MDIEKRKKSEDFFERRLPLKKQIKKRSEDPGFFSKRRRVPIKLENEPLSVVQPEIKKAKLTRKKAWGIVSVCILLAVFSGYFFFKNRNVIDNSAYTLAVHKLNQGQFDEASEDLKKIVEEDEKNTQALENLAVSEYNLGRHEEAIESYNKAIENSEKNFTSYNGLGNIYRDKGDYAKAEESYRRAIELNPKFSTVYSNLAIMLMDQGKKDQAREVIKAGLAANPSDEQLKRIENILN